MLFWDYSSLFYDLSSGPLGFLIGLRPGPFPTLLHVRPGLQRCCIGLLQGVLISWAHGVVVSNPLSMREALGSSPSVSMFIRGPK